MSDSAADFTAIAGKIAPLIRVLASPLDGEVVAAARALTRVLTNNGFDIHTLAERIEHGGDPLREDEMRAIWRHCEAYTRQCVEAEYAAERAAAMPEPNGVFTTVRTVERPAEPGVNGYTWQQIADHCAKNEHVFSGRNLEFIRDLPGKLRQYGSPTLKQANWLKDLFMTRCNGRIE